MSDLTENIKKYFIDKVVTFVFLIFLVIVIVLLGPYIRSLNKILGFIVIIGVVVITHMIYSFVQKKFLNYELPDIGYEGKVILWKIQTTIAVFLALLISFAFSVIYTWNIYYVVVAIITIVGAKQYYAYKKFKPKEEKEVVVDAQYIDQELDQGDNNGNR